MSTESLHMTVLSRAENVAVIRHAVAGLADAVDMHPAGIDDLKTVVTEACMNVVIHAYEDEVGPMEVDAAEEDGDLVVTIADHGGGFRPRADADRDSLRLGLPLIAALSSSFEISGGPGRSTRVTIRMGIAPSAEAEKPVVSPVPEASEATEIKMPTGELVAPVLSRVISVLAARADLSVDRLSDAVLLGDAVSAGASDGFPDGTAVVRVDGDGGEVVVTVGPLADGAASRLRERMRLPELDGSIESLADDVGVESDERGEHLVLRIGREDGV